MSHRIFTASSLLSAILFILLLIAWPVGYTIDPRKTFVTLLPNCHLSVTTRGLDARLKIFNDPRYGPYEGSIIAIYDAPGHRLPSAPTYIGFGDTAGIYFRHFLWPDGRTLWTLSISLLYPLFLTAILPALWWIRRARQRHRGFPITPVQDNVNRVPVTSPATPSTSEKNGAAP